MGVIADKLRTFARSYLSACSNANLAAQPYTVSNYNIRANQFQILKDCEMVIACGLKIDVQVTSDTQNWLYCIVLY